MTNSDLDASYAVMEMWCGVTQGTEAMMKCLRVYSTADGESHFGEVEIPTTSRQGSPQCRGIRSVGEVRGVKHPFHAHSVGCATGRLAYSAGARTDSAARWIGGIPDK